MTQQTPQRVIVAGHSTTIPIPVDTTMSLHSWLSAQTTAHEAHFQWLLLHAETGVIWGERRGDELALSIPAATLSWNALQQARLFGSAGELLMWQGPQGVRARLIRDGSGAAAEWLDEQQMLWGNRAGGEQGGSAGFTAITEGSQGITHAPPIGDSLPIYREPNKKQHETDRARLLVRHYLGEDESGVARVSYSRLVKLVKPGEK